LECPLHGGATNASDQYWASLQYFAFRYRGILSSGNSGAFGHATGAANRSPFPKFQPFTALEAHLA
jgi:hypothetical protein